MIKLTHLENEYKLRQKHKKLLSNLKSKFPHKENLTLNLYDVVGEKSKQMNFNFTINEWQATKEYTHYLFKSKDKHVLTAKDKYWLKPKYNKK